jgi:hypothetical protein
MTVCDPIELFDADCLQDPYPLYDQLRAAGAVGQIGESEFYAVSSWDAVVDVITRVDEFSSNLTATASCCSLIWRRRRSARWKPSSPTLPTGCGSMGCAPGASNGWAPWPTGCQ